MMEAAIDRVLEAEGGFVDHPADRGGPTNYGITLPTLTMSRGQKCTVEDIRELTLYEARSIYFTDYWMRPGFATLGLHKVPAEMLFDAAVNHGPARAVKILQDTIGVLADGIVGPATRERASQFAPLHLSSMFMAERVRFYGQIISKDPSQAVFAAGWMARCAGFIEKISHAQY